MKRKLKNYLPLLIVLFVANASFAQTPTLEMYPNGANTTLGNGPLTSNQVIILDKNTDNPTGASIGTYSPVVTVTYSLSNQQFTSVEGIPGTPGTVFGGTNSSGTANGTNGSVGSAPLFPAMSTISASDNTNYTSCTTCAAGTGIELTANNSVTVYNITDALITSTGVQNFALNARVQFADLTFTFSQPVSNPIIHITGIGGNSAYAYNDAYYTLGLSTEIDMVTPGLSFTALSGSTYFAVSPTTISNNATDIGAQTPGAVYNSIIRYAASGSVQVTGTNITSFTVRLYLKGDGGKITSASSGAIVPATGSNVVRWALHDDFIPTAPGFPDGTLQEGVSGDRFMIGVSLAAPVSVSGNVFNDVNGGNVNNSSGTTNAVPSGIYANLIDAAGNVVSSVAVNTNGTYSFPSVFSGTYTVKISQTQGLQGNAAPVAAAPANWGITGEFNGAANTGNDGNPNGTSASFTVAGSNIGNINFGIQRLPESSVNTQIVGNNGGGTTTTTVNPLWFVNSNVGANPNTQDYNGGTVTSIRITAFPSNATSITINGVTYTSATWPAGGVTIPYTAGVGPTQTIAIDPVDGLVNVVIPFAAIDNAGGEDPTPGSVTLSFTSALPLQLISFSAAMDNNTVNLNWIVGFEINVMKYEIQHSQNTFAFETIGQKFANNSRNYSFTHLPTSAGINYYRLKTIDNDGQVSYSGVIIVNTGVNTAESIKVYPVPAKDYLYISVNRSLQNQSAKVQLFSADGSIVFTKQITALSQTEMIYVGNLASGKYTLQVLTKKEALINHVQLIK